MPLQLRILTLTQFKNYEHANISCAETLNGFTGLNGMGKTNLLDAIYYLCMGRSHLSLPDSYLSRHGSSFFRLVGEFDREGKQEEIVAKVEPRKSKELLRNGVAYDRLSDHVGFIPVVFIAPDDTALVREGSEDRRRFLDNTLSQIDRTYLRQLITYQKVLRQRNALLKKFGERGRIDPALLDAFDEQLLAPAAYIHERRKEFLELFSPILSETAAELSGHHEEVDCIYRSRQLEEDYPTLLKDTRAKDKILERTTTGPHKDDLVFTLDGHPLKKYGSQGQVKTFVLALKLAQYELLRREIGQAPILLLDDIFDKLDRTRVERLLHLLVEKKFGQLFITDTHRHRLDEIMRQVDTGYRIFTVQHGKVSPENQDRDGS